MVRTAASVFLVLLLAACGPRPEPANPALWQVEYPEGQPVGWLFGTVHALERPADWRSAQVNEALARAAILIVEVADFDDGKSAAKVWKRFSQRSGLSPLPDRVSPERRPMLEKVMSQNGLGIKEFDQTDTWAAALIIAQAATQQLDSAYGIDRAVMKAASGKPVFQLEGRAGQLRIFDKLPESEQRDMLEAVVADVARGRDEGADLAVAWRTGDMTTIEAETRHGLLADPELHEALLTRRNRRWAQLIIPYITTHKRPFVAVGAAHLPGPEGLVTKLREVGYTVRRIQ